MQDDTKIISLISYSIFSKDEKRSNNIIVPEILPFRDINFVCLFNCQSSLIVKVDWKIK